LSSAYGIRPRYFQGFPPTLSWRRYRFQTGRVRAYPKPSWICLGGDPFLCSPNTGALTPQRFFVPLCGFQTPASKHKHLPRTGLPLATACVDETIPRPEDLRRFTGPLGPVSCHPRAVSPPAQQRLGNGGYSLASALWELRF
jgi:hypothetical protein